jgi:hypothetical protein
MHERTKEPVHCKPLRSKNERLVKGSGRGTEYERRGFGKEVRVYLPNAVADELLTRTRAGARKRQWEYFLLPSQEGITVTMT